MVKATRKASSFPGFRGFPDAIVFQLAGKRFKGAADLIAFRIFEKRLRNQIVLAALPRRDRAEYPGGVVASRRTSPSTGRRFWASTPMARTRMPWSRGRGNLTTSGSRVPAAGRAMVQSESADRFVDGRTDAKRMTISSFERQAVGVGPRRPNVERISMPRAKRPPALPVRKDSPLLHAARIEEQRVARVIGAPEIGLDGQKSARLDALGQPLPTLSILPT